MRRRFITFIAATLLLGQATGAQDKDPCTKFTWNVTKELAVMKQSPQPIAVAVKAGTGVPQLALESLYALKLADQSKVAFIVKPAKPTIGDGAQAGIARFHTTQAGRYRVALTSGHWLDVVDGDKSVASRDFQGQRGCERPRKIVEFELSGGHDYSLQFSGSTDAEILVSVTAAPPA